MEKDRYPVVIPDVDYYRQMIKCQAACPVMTDGRGYVTAIARNELNLGYQIAHDPNPLSTICGRICGAPCEVACRRTDVDPDYKAVAIRPLKRVLTERFGPESWRTPADVFSSGVWREAIAGADFSAARWSRQNLLALAATPGRKQGKVAIIGAGPSSLSAAHDLAILGHQATIYEAGPKAGGMMRFGVPFYRIDWEAMDREIESIMRLGVTIHFDTRVGEDITLEALRREYDAVYLGIGLMQGRKLNIEGNDLDGVIPAVDLLLNYNLGYRVDLGRRVIVVGGGDVAMDAARTAMRLNIANVEQKAALADQTAWLDDEAETMRTALDAARTVLRMGAADVKVIALESWEELPASGYEVDEAREEGIQIFPRHGPVRAIGENGQVKSLEVIDVASVFDENGRFNPRFIPGTNRTWECDTIILAIGQSADLAVLQGSEDIQTTPRGLVVINPQNGQTSATDVFAGGDVAYGPRLIIHAIYDGHVAALGIEELIQGKQLVTRVNTVWKEIPNHKMPKNWMKYQRSQVPSTPLERRTGISQIELGYSVEEAKIQGLRCLECSINTIFDSSKCILCNGCVDVCPWDCLKIVRVDALQGEATLASLVDISLGNGMERWAAEETPTVAAMIKDDTACTRCGLCTQRCPTGAISMETFRFDELLTYSIPSGSTNV